MNDRIREIDRKLEREIDRNLELAIKFDHREYMDREHDRRMADANSIEIIHGTDRCGNPEFRVKAYTTYASGRVAYIGGMTTASLAQATVEAHRYALLPGSHTLSQEIQS